MKNNTLETIGKLCILLLAILLVLAVFAACLLDPGMAQGISLPTPTPTREDVPLKDETPEPNPTLDPVPSPTPGPTADPNGPHYDPFGSGYPVTTPEPVIGDAPVQSAPRWEPPVPTWWPVPVVETALLPGMR